MSARGLAALVVGLGGGYLKGKDRQRREDIEDEDRAYTMSERARTTAERDRADRLRVDMGAASAPAMVDAAPTPMPIGSRDEPRAPEDTGTRVNGKTFTNQADVQAAIAAYDAPQAMAARQAQVAASAGDPHLAQQLRTGAMQEQAAKYALNAAERAELDARFNADLQANVNSWESFDKFTSESAADGQGGKLKLKSVPSPDGKSMVVNVVLPDGTLKPTSRVFPNSADGLALATAELARMPADKKLAHLHQKAMIARQAQNDEETARHHKELERLTGDKTAAQIEIATMRGEVARAKAAGAAQPHGMTLADLKDGHRGIATTLNADWKAQIDAETDPAKLKAIKVARENEIATVQRLYTGAMSAGFGLTPEQAIVAFRSGEAAKQTFRSRDGSGTVTVEGVMYGGRFIPLADNPGAMPGAKPAGAAPGGAASATPADPADAGQRVKQTPVVDFTGGNSAVNKRVAAAQSSLPALEGAVKDALQKVKDAAGRGPMAVAAARNDLSNARTALADMQARAGQ